MMDVWQKTIVELKTYRAMLHHRLTKLDQAIAIIEEIKPYPLDSPDSADKNSATDKPPAMQKPQGKDPRGGNRPKKPFSLYKGVMRLAPLKNGTQRFRASIWRDGKNRSLGNFVGENAELEAALAAAKARGETDLVLDLEAQLEQAQNNPDRPVAAVPSKRTGQHLSATKAYQGKFVWQCNRCGHDHPSFSQTDRPDHCESCQAIGMTRLEAGKRNLPEGVTP